jgi:NAD(P)-dependent dehydrogenase (short-subunit alcohol dehydrogenase family)
MRGQRRTNSLRRRLVFVWHGVTAAIKQPAPVTWAVASPAEGREFDGQVVVVTGAGGVVGGPLVDAFAAAGASVHALDVDAAELQRRASHRKRSSWAGRVHDHVIDLRDSEAISRFATTMTSVDVLVNNAAVKAGVTDIGDMTAESLRSVLDVNVVGPATLTASLADALSAEQGGSVVFVTSIHSSRSSRWVQYGTSKGAQRKLTVDFAGALAERGVRVNAVAPGWTVEFDADPDDRVAPQNLLGSSTVPVDAIVQAVMFLADRFRSPMTTGQELVVDGGALLFPRR